MYPYLYHAACSQCWNVCFPWRICSNEVSCSSWPIRVPCIVRQISIVLNYPLLCVALALSGVVLLFRNTCNHASSYFTFFSSCWLVLPLWYLSHFVWQSTSAFWLRPRTHFWIYFYLYGFVYMLGFSYSTSHILVFLLSVYLFVLILRLSPPYHYVCSLLECGVPAPLSALKPPFQLCCMNK